MTLDRVAARTPDGHTLFDNLSLALARERTGLVGRNGAGKTTLLRLIAGMAEPAEGAVARAGTVGWLAQRGEPAADETVGHTLGVAEPLAVLARVLAGEGTADDLAEADWSLEARLDEVLAEVGLGGLSTDRLTASLSGGEQTRLRLAALFLVRPDLILLDEPTNNLDTEGRAIVTEAIARWPGGAVVVSHDRALLRRMDRIVELSGLGASSYGGGYDLYAERKAAERAAAERDLETAEQDARRVARESQKAVEKKTRRDRAGQAYAMSGSAPKIVLGAMARRAEESSARENRLATRLKEDAGAALGEAREKVERARALDIPMPPTGLAAGRTVLTVDEACWGPVLKPVSLKLVGPERVAVTGPNGAGKTTLLKLIAGELTPAEGRVERPVEAALLDQDAAILRPDETLVEAYRRMNPEATPNDAHAALARFLFRNTAAQRTAGTLSGGERLRAALACVMSGAKPQQLLILDEPTNHLDLDSIAAVEAALRAYDGALIVVSHDRDFLDAIGIEREIRLCG
ncbi:MAG: ABC-F family ATP-binding cassette domain-containing protein [Pseudomonadota bacterium]